MDIKSFIRRNRLKVFLLPVCLFLNVFYFPYLYYFYSRRLKQVSRKHQLFFLARDEFGAILQLLYYVRCWTNVRNGAVLVVFSTRAALIRMLARYICPAAQVISPCDLFSQFMQKAFASFMRRFVFYPLYYNLLRKYPEALFIYETNNGKSTYVKYLDNVYNNRLHDSPFWDAYVQTRGVFDCRYDVQQDSFQLAKASTGITVDEVLVCHLLNDLKIPGRYVVININVKDYFHETVNLRRIRHFERYNVLIDYLINKGYSVVLQGKSEQPYFKSRKGFIDYAHGVFQSPENDLLLFCGCEFFVSSKTGAESYGLLCDKPVLGLNYTELCTMQPNIRFRFFPKRIKDENGKYLSWRTVLTHPVYFQVGRILSTQEKIEFVEMEEHEIIASLEEFLQLLLKPREQWLNYSLQQREFKQMLHPGHLDLYYISGVPCEAYLNEEA
ncbi:MAG: TIGR04372 family glycosyltransferase [Candidatus Omnitrophota bacterium]